MTDLLNYDQLRALGELTKRAHAIRRSVDTFNALASELGLDIPPLYLTVPDRHVSIGDVLIEQQLDRLACRHTIAELQLQHPELFEGTP